MSSKDKHQTEEIVIEKKIVIDASPEVVFKIAYLDLCRTPIYEYFNTGDKTTVIAVKYIFQKGKGLTGSLYSLTAIISALLS